MSLREVVADHARLGHPCVTVDIERYRAQRVYGEIFARLHARRKRQEVQLVIQSQFFEHPQDPERARLPAMVESRPVHGASDRLSSQRINSRNNSESTSRFVTNALIYMWFPVNYITTLTCAFHAARITLLFK